MKKLRSTGRFIAKILIIITALIGGGSLVSSSAFAALTATAFNPGGTGSVAVGTLKLIQAASSVPGITGGFATAISAVAPGDTVNRYVDLTNSGTLDGSTMTLRLTPDAVNALTSDGTNGLQITIVQCSVAYTNAGACSGSETAVVTSTATALVASHIPISLASFLSGAISHLKISITLPAGTEVVENGVLPAGTVQGLTAALTWTFTEALRANTTTNS
ncbi:MAG: hypothetical protein D4S00_07525 [Streptomycetaceae bacterium]|nr:MAG: hypothetical protein D4S00_07525 [Streptomycetaceae bacterium]